MPRRRVWILTGVGLILLILAVVWFAGGIGNPASDWAYEMTGIRAAQARGYSGQGIVVAIIDTGFNAKHPALDHARVVAWKDYVNNRETPYDDAGHGSHVAGVIVGEGGSFWGTLQGLSMKGAAPKASLVIVKAINRDGKGSSDAVTKGIDFAVSNNADVICLSLGSRPTPLNLGTEIDEAVNRAINRGILVVAAAGNTGPNSDDVESPANVDGAIAVGAVDRNKKVADFSARGDNVQNHGALGNDIGAPRSDPNKKPEVVAPGVEIKSTWTGSSFAVAKGTSQAAPFVCGALALLLEAKPSLAAQNNADLVTRVKSGLKASSHPLAGQRTPHDNAAGYGLLDANALINRF